MRNTRRKPRARRETPARMRPRVARAPRGRVASVAQDARKKRRKPHARAFARGYAGACAKPHGTRPYTPSRSASRTHAALRRASARARVPWRATGRRRNREGTRRIGAATRRDMRARDARAHAREKPSRKTRSALRARPSHDGRRPPRESFPRCRNARGKTSCETSRAAPQAPFRATMAHRRAESAGTRENTAQDPLPRRSATVAGDLPVTARNRRGKHADARVNAHFPCARAQPRSVTSRKREPSREALGRRVYTPRGPRGAFCKRRTANAACSFTERTTEAPSNLRKRGRVKKCSIFLHTENRLVYTGKSGAASPLPGLLRLTAPCTRNVCESGAKKNKRA